MKNKIAYAISLLSDGISAFRECQTHADAIFVTSPNFGSTQLDLNLPSFPPAERSFAITRR